MLRSKSNESSSGTSISISGVKNDSFSGSVSSGTSESCTSHQTSDGSMVDGVSLVSQYSCQRPESDTNRLRDDFLLEESSPSSSRVNALRKTSGSTPGEELVEASIFQHQICKAWGMGDHPSSSVKLERSSSRSEAMTELHDAEEAAAASSLMQLRYSCQMPYDRANKSSFEGMTLNDKGMITMSSDEETDDLMSDDGMEILYQRTLREGFDRGYRAKLINSNGQNSPSVFVTKLAGSLQQSCGNKSLLQSSVADHLGQAKAITKVNSHVRASDFVQSAGSRLLMKEQRLLQNSLGPAFDPPVTERRQRRKPELFNLSA